MIKLNLRNNKYSVYALGDVIGNKYTFNLCLRNNYTDMISIITELGIMTWGYHNGYEKEILEKIEDMDRLGIFDKFINKYEYELKCFDVGNTHLSEN